jgi:hypothetical protein
VDETSTVTRNYFTVPEQSTEDGVTLQSDRLEEDGNFLAMEVGGGGDQQPHLPVDVHVTQLAGIVSSGVSHSAINSVPDHLPPRITNSLSSEIAPVSRSQVVWGYSLGQVSRSSELPASPETAEIPTSSPKTVNDMFSCPSFYPNGTHQRILPVLNNVKIQAPEAHLIKVFIKVWGPILDCTDPVQHFATHIPLLAQTRCPYLLYAMLSISALYLSRISNYPAGVAEHYRRQCAGALIPVLQDNGNNVPEEAIFATYVVLRAYDHFSST